MKRQEISNLLYEEWDPLGVKDRAPRDEYDDYAKDIEVFLREGKPVDFLSDYLSEVRTTTLLMSSDRGQDLRVAQMIKARQ